MLLSIAIKTTVRFRKRSFSIAGHRTSIALEDEFWAVFDEIVEARNMAQAELVTEIDTARGDQNLASAIRVACLKWVKSPAYPTSPDETE